MNFNETRRKKKVDYEALGSAFMRVPRMDVRVARYLLDMGYGDLYKVRGMSAESLLEEVKVRQTVVEDEVKVLCVLKMLVYFVEEDEPDKEKMYPEYWKDRG